MLILRQLWNTACVSKTQHCAMGYWSLLVNVKHFLLVDPGCVMVSIFTRLSSICVPWLGSGVTVTV